MGLVRKGLLDGALHQVLNAKNLIVKSMFVENALDIHLNLHKNGCFAFKAPVFIRYNAEVHRSWI